jgi:regulator of protease activity HflC (stomatin/prohibitin superfamily)
MKKWSRNIDMLIKHNMASNVEMAAKDQKVKETKKEIKNEMRQEFLADNGFGFNFDSISLDKRETIIEEDKNAITDRLDAAVPLENLILKPNIQDDNRIIQNIMAYVNTDGLAASLSIVGSTVIEPGKIGLIMHNGKVEVAGPGRWMSLNPRASWGPVKSINETIQYGTLTIVRINKGYYGLATDGGKPFILGEGLHVRNNRLFKYIDTKLVDQEYINHQTIHIIRVPKGKYAKVVDNNIPKILKSGFYVIDSNYFTYAGLVDMSEEYINHQTIHVVRIPKSFIGAISINNKPKLLGEGNYIFNTQLFKYEKKWNICDPVIKHSTITRFWVKNGEIASAWYKSKPIFISKPDIYEIDDPTFIFESCVPATTKLIKLGSRTRFIVYNGEIGLAWDNNKPILIDEPGIYEKDDPTFIFDKCVAATTKKISLGSRTRVIVYDGEVGVSYVKGKLDILDPNTYMFDTNDRIFSGFISTKQQAIVLLEDGSKDPFLRCDTKDFVEVGIKAAVFFRISDPKLTLLTVGDEKAIEKIVRDTSIATMQSIMRSSPLNQVAQSKVVNVKHIHEEKEKAAFAFFDKVHDEFILKLHDSFKNHYGIEISNIRIEDFKIMDEQLATSISKQAMLTAKNENELANLESQREIITAQQERDATVIRIKTDAEALKLKTDTQAKTNAVMMEAQAKAKSTELLASADASAAAVRIKAEAEAKAYSIIAIAEAEAKAIQMKSEAEKKRAENLSSTEIGKQLALLAVQSDMITKSMQGVQKIIYLPPGSNMGNLPLQLFGMQGGFPLLEGQQKDSSIIKADHFVPEKVESKTN